MTRKQFDKNLKDFCKNLSSQRTRAIRDHLVGKAHLIREVKTNDDAWNILAGVNRKIDDLIASMN